MDEFTEVRPEARKSKAFEPRGVIIESAKMPGNPFIDLNCFRTAFQVRERLIPLSRWKVCFSFRDDNRRGACRRQGICLARYWLCSMDRIEPEVLGWEMGRYRAVNPSMQNLSRLADAKLHIAWIRRERTMGRSKARGTLTASRIMASSFGLVKSRSSKGPVRRRCGGL